MTKRSLPTLTFKRIFWGLISCFWVLFLSRLAYSYLDNEPAGDAPFSDAASFFASRNDLRKNYASEKQMNAPPPPPGESMAAEGQKYEKTATLNARSSAFQEDEAKLRATSQQFQAVIQYEQKSGNPGHRSLHLMIGVKPELFDSFYIAAQRIGFVYVNEVTKVDKTTEFRELNAQKASLQKALASLNDLKNKAGSITDLVGLHDKILAIETQLQELGVALGNFAAENEFCTLRFSLYEKAAARTISIARRVIDSLLWTVQYYAIGLFLLGGILVLSWLSMVLIKNARAFNQPENNNP